MSLQMLTKADDTSRVAGYTPTAAGLALLAAADASAQRTALGLGSLAVQAASNVTITGGSIVGLTTLHAPDEAYNATTWDNSLQVPTKNAIRDKIESMMGGVALEINASNYATLQEAVDAARTAGRQLYIPSGIYNISSTLLITTAGSAGTEQYLSIRGDGPILTQIHWTGATDGRAIDVTFNKFFQIHGIGIYNDVAKGTTVGMRLTGPNESGTQTLGGEFSHCTIHGFNVGMQAGVYTGHAASEILYRHFWFNDCNTAWANGDLNTLDHVFFLLLLSGCGTGLNVGSGNACVYGGSASGSTVADFALSNNGYPFSVNDFRSETCERVLTSLASSFATISIRNCLVSGPAAADDIVVDVSGHAHVAIETCVFGACKVRMGLSAGAFLSMNNVAVEGDSDVPFIVNTASYDAAKNLSYDVRNCSRWSGGYYDDESGQFLSLTRVPAYTVDKTTTESLPFVRQRFKSLSSAFTVTGNNLRLQETFAGSGTKVVTFVKSVSVSCASGSSQITFTSGVIKAVDCGKRIVLVAADGSGGDVIGVITTLVTATAAEIILTTTNGVGVTGSVTAQVGENEPDDKYFLSFGPNANEKVSWTDGSKTASQFEMNSDNGTSTATVDIILAR